MIQQRIAGILIYIIIFLSSIFNGEMVLAADNSPAAQPYTLEAEGEIIYDYLQGNILAIEGVIFETEGLSIKAAEMFINLEEALVEAQGELMIRIEDQLVTGDYLRFNYQDLTGSIQGAETNLDELRFKGQEIRFVQDLDYQLEILEANFTNCLLTEEPHYHISARQLKVYPDNKIVAKDVSLYLGKTRLITLPSYVVEYQVGEEEGFKDLMPVPQLGYNSQDGWNARVNYPYEITEGNKGSITAEYLQKGEWNIELEHQYLLTENWQLIGLYHNLLEEEEEGDFNREETLSGGVAYQKDSFLVKSLLSYDLLNQEYTSQNRLQYTAANFRLVTDFNYNFETAVREEKFSLKYLPSQKIGFSFYQEYENELLNKESYELKYNGKSSWMLAYRDGYEVNYLPYLTVTFPELKALNISLKSGIGLGKQENEGIKTAKVELRLAADQKINITPGLAFNLKGEVMDTIYYQEEISYFTYQLEFGSSVHRRINDKIQVAGSLGYVLARDKGTPYIPADELETEESINPSLKISYQLPQEMAFWELELAGEYLLPEREIEELLLKLTKRYDCYQYSFIYNLLDNSLGINIEF